MTIEEAKKIIETEELHAGYLYEPFSHIINYDGIVLEKVEDGYRVCRRSVCERDTESDYDVAVFEDESDALDDFIAKLRKINEQNKALAEYNKKRQKRSELDALTVKVSCAVLTIFGILGLYYFWIEHISKWFL